MKIPDLTLLRAYGNEDVFFKMASGGPRVSDRIGYAVAGELLKKLAKGVTIPQGPLTSALRMKTLAQAPMGFKGVPPAQAALGSVKTLASAVAPSAATSGAGSLATAKTVPGAVLPGSSKAYNPFDKSTFGHQNDELGVSRASRNAALAARRGPIPSSVSNEAARQTSSGLQSPGALGGPRVATNALMGPPAKPGTAVRAATTAGPASAGALTPPAASKGSTAAPPAAEGRGGVPWNKLLLTGGALGMGYLGLKGVEAGLGALGSGGHVAAPASYGYAPGGYQVPATPGLYG